MTKKANKFDIDPDSVSHDALKDLYRRLLASRNSVQQDNRRLASWAERASEAATQLACEGSLAFQVMAEKAGIRSHPSVTKAVELFDNIAHPQWKPDGDKFPKIEWPEDWDLDEPEAWTGDADMQANSAIEKVLEVFDHLRFMPGVKADFYEHIRSVERDLQKTLQRGIQGVKERAGFRPKHISPPDAAHYRDMSREQLVDLVGDLGWMALDLAQDMHSTNFMLRRDLRASAYRRIGDDLYVMSQMAMEPRPEGIDIKVFGDEQPF